MVSEPSQHDIILSLIEDLEIKITKCERKTTHDSRSGNPNNQMQNKDFDPNHWALIYKSVCSVGPWILGPKNHLPNQTHS